MRHIPILLTLATLLFVPHAAAADAPRILVVETMPVEVVLELSRATVDHLAELGFRDGETADIVLIKAEGNRDLAEERIRAAAQEQRPDLVITLATLASQAAHEIFIGTDVPVLFGGVSDPVGAGIVPATGAPAGTNITGLVHSIFREAKIDLAMRLLGPDRPRPTRIGIVHTSYPSDRGDLAELLKAAAHADITFLPLETPYLGMPEGKEAMFSEASRLARELEGEVDYWWILTGPLGECPEFMNVFPGDAGGPVLLGNTMDHVRAGALLSVTGDYRAWGVEMAELAALILQGEDPGAIPVKPFSDFIVGVNLTTALSHELVVPPDILRLAGDNVYR